MRRQNCVPLAIRFNFSVSSVSKIMNFRLKRTLPMKWNTQFEPGLQSPLPFGSKSSDAKKPCLVETNTIKALLHFLLHDDFGIPLSIHWNGYQPKKLIFQKCLAQSYQNIIKIFLQRCIVLDLCSYFNDYKEIEKFSCNTKDFMISVPAHPTSLNIWEYSHPHEIVQNIKYLTHSKNLRGAVVATKNPYVLYFHLVMHFGMKPPTFRSRRQLKKGAP